MLTWKYIIVLDIIGKHNFNFFYYIHNKKFIVQIPTNKKENSYKLKLFENRELCFSFRMAL